MKRRKDVEIDDSNGSEDELQSEQYTNDNRKKSICKDRVPYSKKSRL